MDEWVRRYLSPDDLWSVIGYVLLVSLTQLNTPRMALPLASLLASGMLTVFWLASEKVRSRNADRAPNARVVLWAGIALASVIVALRG